MSLFVDRADVDSGKKRDVENDIDIDQAGRFDTRSRTPDARVANSSSQELFGREYRYCLRIDGAIHVLPLPVDPTDMHGSHSAMLSARHFQIFAGQLTTTVDAHELAPMVSALVDALPSPSTVCDRTMLTIFISRAIMDIVEHLHLRTQASDCACFRGSAAALKSLLSLTTRDIGQDFRVWFDEFRGSYTAHHPLCVACATAKLIRAQPARRWTLEHVATTVAVTPAQLTKTYRAEFGLTLHEYVELVRLWRAVPLLVNGVKIEAVATDVGYASKKNFYDTFDRWLGMTPKSVRFFEEARLDALNQRLKRLVVKVCSTARDGSSSLRRSA